MIKRNEKQQMQSTRALGDFIRHWRAAALPGWGNTPAGLFYCQAKVRFDWPTSFESQTTKVWFCQIGIEDGKVRMEDAGKINDKDTHTEFRQLWSEYTFDGETFSLVIEGNSPKIGSYTVVISPVAE